MSDGHPRTGRPRDPNIDEALAVACRELLAEVGYSELSIDAVSRRAGVGRPAVYRRWESKAQMVAEIVFAEPPEIPARDTGDTVADLTAWAGDFYAYLSQPAVRAAAAGMTAEWVLHPEVHEHIWGATRQPVRDAFVGRVRAAMAAGDIRPDIDVELMFNTVAGVMIYLLMLDMVPDGDFAGRLITMLLNGVRTTR